MHNITNYGFMAEVRKVQTNLYVQNISIQSLLTMPQYYNYLLSLLHLFISYFRGELKEFYFNDKGFLEATTVVYRPPLSTPSLLLRSEWATH